MTAIPGDLSFIRRAILRPTILAPKPPPLYSYNKPPALRLSVLLNRRAPGFGWSARIPPPSLGLWGCWSRVNSGKKLRLDF